MIYNLMEAAMDEFSYDELKSIGSFKGRYTYCLQMLGKPIGKGSSRVVFQIDDDKVLKLAFNNKGVAQNEAECDWGLRSYDIVPTIYDFEENYQYIVSEYVLPSKKEDFQHCLGVSFDDYCNIVKSIYNCYARRPIYTPINHEQLGEILDNNEWFSQMYDVMANFGFSYGDYVRMANIGLANRDGDATLVLLDNGLNDDIFNQYYKKF